MKLIIQNDRVVGMANDNYIGPEFAVVAPADFDGLLIDKYFYINGVVTLDPDYTPEEPVIYDPVTHAPNRVSMRQARLALHQQNLLTTIDAAVAQMDAAAQIEWAYAQEIKKDHPLVQSIKTALGWTDQQLDDLFILAGTL